MNGRTFFSKTREEIDITSDNKPLGAYLGAILFNFNLKLLIYSFDLRNEYLKIMENKQVS